MKLVFKFLVRVIGIVLIANPAKAQETTIVYDSIFSQVLNEQRKLEILIPEEYKLDPGAKYDVIYLLDGETLFYNFSFICNFAKNEKLIPPTILVAIPNICINEQNMRDRDFLPEESPENNKGGGADNFIRFFKNELIPYVDKKYPSSGENSLFGHSLGGLFTFYVLLKEPNVFTNYYCSDPAFPWNNRRIIKMAQETFQNPDTLNRNLWINGVENTFRNVGIQKMDSVLKESAPVGLRWKVSIYPHETHMSVLLKGIYDGLKYTYNGYNSRKMAEFHPNNGALLKDKPAPVFLNGSFPDVYYTTDGSEPDTSSKKAPQMIWVSGPAELRVKWIGENEKYSITSKGNFEIGNVWPSIPVQDFKPGGLRFSYYEGEWEKLPDFSKLYPVEKGIADSTFSLQKFPADSNFGYVFEGYIKIEMDGYYNFALCSSDGSNLFINGRKIIDNDGLHGSEWYKSFVLPLQKGYYPIRMEYFQRMGKCHLDLIYISPDTYETVNLKFKDFYF